MWALMSLQSYKSFVFIISDILYVINYIYTISHKQCDTFIFYDNFGKCVCVCDLAAYWLSIDVYSP